MYDIWQNIYRFTHNWNLESFDLRRQGIFCKDDTAEVQHVLALGSDQVWIDCMYINTDNV